MIPHFVPYVCRIDLLEKALVSVKSQWSRTIIVDNRDVGSTEPDPAGLRRDHFGFLVWKPEFPLNHSQLLTWLTQRVEKRGDEFFTWMHHDCEVVDESAARLVDSAQAFTNAGDKWGVILTEDVNHKGIWNHVDVLAAINVRAALAIGGWDWVRFPDYYSDYDFYSRLVKAGYSVLQSQLNIIHQQGGTTTVKSDPNRAVVNRETWDARGRLWELRKQELGTTWPPS